MIVRAVFAYSKEELCLKRKILWEEIERNNRALVWWSKINQFNDAKNTSRQTRSRYSCVLAGGFFSSSKKFSCFIFFSSHSQKRSSSFTTIPCDIAIIEAENCHTQLLITLIAHYHCCWSSDKLQKQNEIIFNASEFLLFCYFSFHSWIFFAVTSTTIFMLIQK